MMDCKINLYDYLNGTVIGIYNPLVKRLKRSCFNGVSTLQEVNFPNCSFVDRTAFGNCSNLLSVNLPNCNSIERYAFSGCSNLLSVNLPNCKSIESYAFWNCSRLSMLSLPVCSSIEYNAFDTCTSLESIYLGTSSVFGIDSDIFENAGITPSTGTIFVRTSLINAFKSAIGWSYFSNRIFGYNFEYGEEENGAGGG